MTRWWRDVRAVMTVAVLLAAILSAFPYSSLKFSARTVPTIRPASAAFVTLSDEAAETAFHAAKTAWQSETSAMQRMRVRLPLGELPEDDDTPLELSFGDRSALDGAKPLAYPKPAYAPSSAAKPPAPFPPDAPPVPFSKNELLGI